MGIYALIALASEGAWGMVNQILSEQERLARFWKDRILSRPALILLDNFP